ncbi:MAG: tRNA lysidine(34) synthetase TilS [Thermodesulfobacteriota bacterium]|nr:tRNA lysidine(34) synthetase TilS [Thermodesulfobacteriota bacterium]
METKKKSNTGKTIIQTACRTVSHHGMIDCNDCLLIGISGGPDSVALLLFLIEIQKKYSITLGIAHINHTLRGKDSDRDAKFVQSLAKKHNLPFFLETKDVKEIAKKKKLSIEVAAREVRYSFYGKTCKKENFSKIVLGHNKDDNAELVLMNLLRGSGPTGLSGIPPKRDNWIIRPFMDISKQDILDFLKTKDQKYVIDASNYDPKFLRNRIRKSLIPMLKKDYNPNITESLDRLSKIIKDENQWMEKETEFNFSKALKEKNHNEVQLSIDFFKNIDPALVKRLFRRAIKEVKGDLRRITSLHIDAAAELVSSGIHGKSLDLPDRIRIIIKKDSVSFKKEKDPLREIGKLKKEQKNFLAYS